jgi:hydrogenase maturation factor
MNKSMDKSEKNKELMAEILRGFIASSFVMMGCVTVFVIAYLGGEPITIEFAKEFKVAIVISGFATIAILSFQGKMTHILPPGVVGFWIGLVAFVGESILLKFS